MHVIQLLESSDIAKAGIIPFIRTERGVEMLFMRSSDPDFGGPDLMIAKGHIDDGETPQQAAVREGGEELGLKPSNFAQPPFIVHDQQVRGLTATYIMRIMAVEVKSKEDFGQYHYETAETVWLTGEEYAKVGRKSQLVFVQALLKQLS